MSIDERLERLEKLLIIGTKAVLSTAEVAIMLGVSEGRVRHLVCNRTIPYYKQGRSVYFKKSEIEDWQLRDRIPTTDEIRKQAVTYVVKHPRNK